MGFWQGLEKLEPGKRPEIPMPELPVKAAN
jgi:hypothetical protein